MGKAEGIKAAMSIADDIAAGKLSPDDLDTAVADQCRELFATVYGPDDPLWKVQIDVARQVLALDGIPVNELAEWLALSRMRSAARVQPNEDSADLPTPGKTAPTCDDAAEMPAILGEYEDQPGGSEEVFDTNGSPSVDAEDQPDPSRHRGSSWIAARGREVPRDESVPPPALSL